MAVTIKASKQGLEKVDLARKKKGWQATAAAWCDAAKTSEATLKRFRQGEPILQDVFINICQAVGLDWREIVDEPGTSSQIKWLVKLEADDTLLDAIFALIKQHSGDASLKLERIESGSVILVLSGSQEGFKRIEYLFKTGQLTEILGVPILDVRLEPIKLSEWLQNNFVEALQAGWQTLEEIFGTTTASPSFRAHTVKRAKEIELGDRTVALFLNLTPVAKEEISILLGVYPTGNQSYLPENLNIAVFSDSEEPLVEITAPNNSQGVVQELFFFPGEHFSVNISLGDSSNSEYFII